MKQLYVYLFTLAMPLQIVSAKESRFECPPEVKTIQSTKEKPSAGWSALRETQSKNGLDTVGVFDGPPQELASLIPDNEENRNLAKVIWTFNPKKERPIYMACSYLRTDIILTKALPLESTQCKAILSKSKPLNVLGLICK